MTLTTKPNRPAGGHHLLLLAPDNCWLPGSFQKSEVNQPRYDALLAAMQRMRGAIYLGDGAIHAGQLTPDGRHAVESDRKSWHVLSVDSEGEVVGCSRYREHDLRVGFQQLGVGKSAVANDSAWGDLFRSAIHAEMLAARRSGMAFVEVGGWAVENSMRLTTEALRIALSTFALARRLGGCIGVTTATVRHCSSRILRKIGGRCLTVEGTEIPSYYDPQYRCEMEVLRFDSRRPAARFQPWIDAIFHQLGEAPVVWRQRDSEVPAQLPFEVAMPRYRSAQAGR
jgi:hypothetical protein